MDVPGLVRRIRPLAVDSTHIEHPAGIRYIRQFPVLDRCVPTRRPRRSSTDLFSPRALTGNFRN